MAHDRFEVLFVCHANLCRSPLAERLARHAFDQEFGFEAASQVSVRSGGTHGWDGSPMHAGSIQVLDECGVGAGEFVSRTVDVPMLTGSDLILTAAREQRAACVTLAPATVRRTFTLKQFARLAAAARPVTGGAPAERMAELVDRVNAVRHLVPASDDDDLADPVGRPIEAFRECAQSVWTELTTIVRAVAVAQPPVTSG